jgi:O-antigen/teichoic acid export membrane protein
MRNVDGAVKFHKMKSEYVDSVREVGKGGSVSFLTGVMGQGIRFCFHMMMSRVLGASGYGLYSLGHSILQISHLISMIGLQNGVVHFLAIFRGEGDQARVRGTILCATVIVAATSTFVAFCLWFLADWISEHLFEEPSLRGILRAFAVALPFHVLLMLFAYCARGFRNMKYYSGAIEVMHPLGNLILVGGAFWIGMQLEGALWGFILSTAITMLLLVRVMFRLFPQILTLEDGCRFEARRILSYAMKVVPIDLSKPLLNDQTDNILLGYFGVARDVGIYSVGFLISAKIGFFQHMFNGIFAPIVADLYNRGKHRELSQLFKTVSKWTLLLTLPILFAFVFAGPEILGLFGREFGEGWSVLTILALSNLFNISAGPSGFMLLMTGRPTVELINSGVVGLSNILLNAWLIPRYGAVGAAMGTGLSMVFLNLIRLIEVYYIHRCHPFRFGTVKTLAAFALSWGVLWQLGRWFPFEGLWSLTAIVPFILLYGGLLTVFGWDQEDTFILERLCHKMRRSMGSREGQINGVKTNKTAG